MKQNQLANHDSLFTLALLIYAGFIALFIFGEKKKYLLLFTISYFIAAL